MREEQRGPPDVGDLDRRHHVQRAEDREDDDDRPRRGAQAEPPGRERDGDDDGEHRVRRRGIDALDPEQGDPERHRGVVACEREGERRDERRRRPRSASPGGRTGTGESRRRGRARARGRLAAARAPRHGAAGRASGTPTVAAVTASSLAGSSCRARAPAGSRRMAVERPRRPADGEPLDTGRERLPARRRLERERDRRLVRVQPPGAGSPGDRRRAPRLPRSTTASCVCAYQSPGRGASARRKARSRRRDVAVAGARACRR